MFSKARWRRPKMPNFKTAVRQNQRVAWRSAATRSGRTPVNLPLDQRGHWTGKWQHSVSPITPAASRSAPLRCKKTRARGICQAWNDSPDFIFLLRIINVSQSYTFQIHGRGASCRPNWTATNHSFTLVVSDESNQKFPNLCQCLCIRTVLCECRRL